MKKLMFLLFLISVASSAKAQDSTVVSDYETWAGVSVQKSFLKKKLELGFTQEFRFDDNSTHLDQYFSELTLDYEFYKGFKIGGGYRFIRNNKNSGYKNEQRLFADLSYKHKIDRWTLNYRLRFQNHDELGVSRDAGDDITQKYRLRVKAGYNIKNWKVDPYVSVEGFFARENRGVNYIESITERVIYSGFEKLRYTIGLDYSVKKWFEISAYYRIEQGFKSYPAAFNTPTILYVGGLNLTFKL
ncbi:MAG: hypothetical protein A3D92_19310 [Bacteroidetes bacterium RIFCSPHIGHO2_02_FULL_44_7]|nr:MAG: hypothetical protein A3D92_19310 [Bacteroidetes bacterium RIFCSPHIGHO2_02_FULL_44_7]